MCFTVFTLCSLLFVCLQCWENYIGIEIYKLVIMDFIFVLGLTFVSEFIRRWVNISKADHTASIEIIWLSTLYTLQKVLTKSTGIYFHIVAIVDIYYLNYCIRDYICTSVQVIHFFNTPLPTPKVYRATNMVSQIRDRVEHWCSILQNTPYETVFWGYVWLWHDNLYLLDIHYICSYNIVFFQNNF